MAELLDGKYSFWLEKDSLYSDTHGLFITTSIMGEELQAHHRDWLNAHFTKLCIGHDYFHDIDIPYVNNEDYNPDFHEVAGMMEMPNSDSVDNEKIEVTFQEVLEDCANENIDKKDRILGFLQKNWIALAILAYFWIKYGSFLLIDQ